MKHLGDITKLNGAEIPVVDVIAGGSPCQDLSVAGKRAGLAGERSGLFMEQMRVIKEMREHDRRANLRAGVDVRPRFCIWENVPGALTSGATRGADFAAVLEEFIKVAEPDSNVCLSAPRGGWSHSGCYYAEDGSWSLAWRLHDAQFWGIPQRRKRIALVADFGGLSAPEILFERRGLRWDTEEKQGERKADSAGTGGRAGEAVDDVTAYRKTGHPTQKGGGQGWEQATVSDTLNAFDCSEKMSPMIVYENHSQDSRYRRFGDICETVSAKYGTGGNNQPLVLGPSFCIGNGQADLFSHITEELAQTLNCMHDQLAVLVHGDAKENSESQSSDTVVRRLTPEECELLQGFPRGWTDIGEWVDEKGKKHRLADSPRYKALGNSICTPFWFWLLRRISAQYERPATLGSLFSGIGGFEYCWARCNGSKYALWASEIEQFPIAVVKKHFGDEDAEIEGDIGKYL